jgi:transposase
MLDAATVAEIRRLYYAEHWRIGTICSQLGVHADAVRRALHREPGEVAPCPPRRRITDPYVALLTETLQRYPRLRATVLYRMLQERGYKGSVVQLRRVVRTLRPQHQKEAFLRLQSLPGEAAQVDWADFGSVNIGRARRRLSAFVMTLSYSRALYVEFFFGQTLVNFLRGHVRAFEHFGGVARTLLTDNLRSVVLERRGEQIRLHPRYLELAGHYCFQPKPCHVARGNEKGRVERSIRYLRESFFAARSFTTLSDLNEKVWAWCTGVAARRPWPDNPKLTVAEVFAQEQRRLLPLPKHRLDTSERALVRSDKTLWVRFDRNDYSIPPEAVGWDLILEASETEIRLIKEREEIARHRRCYDQGQRITNPAHTEALLAQKRAALGSAAGSPLRLAVPEAERFLDAAFDNHRGTTVLITHLTRLLELYGAEALNCALAEALKRGTPNLASVEFLLEQHRRAANRRPPLPVDLTERPELAALHVQPHNLSAYDQLSQSAPDEEGSDE